MKNNISLISVSFCIALWTGTAVAAPMDPVTGNEISRAKSMAMASFGTAMAASRRATPATSNNRLAARAAVDTETFRPTIEFLRVQPHRFSKSEMSSNKRWADTTAYDYTTDELVTSVIDLNSDKIVSTTRHKNMQPPMAASEIKRAISIVFEDDDERSILNTEFTRITGENLTSIDQLQYKAFTFFADSMPSVVNSASKPCGAQRCAQLMLYTHDNIVFEVSPIVNLSAGLVTQRMGY